jgi:hypothetical protein
MDDANSAELQSALQHRENLEAALDRVLASVGVAVANHANEVLRGDRTEGIPPEAREGIAQILHGKGHIEDADAQILKLRGYPDAASYHEDRRDNYWRLREAIRARR